MQRSTPPLIPPHQHQQHLAPWRYPHIGVSHGGKQETIDLATLPHLLVGGTTGMGKSNFMNHAITSLLKTGNAELILIDPEEVEFAKYKDEASVTYAGMEQAEEAIAQVAAEKKRKRGLFLNQQVVQFSQLEPTHGLKRIVVVIDEYASLVLLKQFQRTLVDLARVGRKFGIHLIVATQHPDKDVINLQVRSNLPCALAFGVKGANNAKLLSAPGAEKIRTPELAYLVRGGHTLLIQTPKAATWAPVAPVAPKKIDGSVSGSLNHCEPLNHYSQKQTQEAMECDFGQVNHPPIQPAQRGEPSATFMNLQALTKLIGSVHSGFRKARFRKDGKLLRGYWVKRSDIKEHPTP